MKKMIFFAVFTCLQTLAGKAQSGSGGTPPYLLKSLSGESINKVDLETTGGNISIVGVAAAEARLEVYIWGNNDRDLPKEEIQKRLSERYEFNISVAGNKLTAIARPKSSMNWNNKGLTISFKAYVPVGVSSNLRTSGGNINLKNLAGGNQEFRTSGGNLDVDQLSGKLNGRTSGGNINLSDSKDDIDLSTSGGNIEAINCQGDMRLSTSGGNLKLRLLQGTIRATTSGGDVRGEEVSGDLQTRTSGGNIRLRDLSCSLNASTSAGDVDITMKSLGKFITLTNSGGNISLQLPQDKGLNLTVNAEEVRTTRLTNFKGDIDQKHIDGTINGGGIPVKLSGSGGNVNLTFK
ncbi:DUF4097 family beta strand repeat-containing protein [Flavitalea flava]